MEIYYLTQSQLDAIDPTWDYENQGTMYPGWYFWPERYELPQGPYRTRDECEGARIRFALAECTMYPSQEGLAP